MNDTALQVAMRELRSHLGDRNTLVVLTGLSLILGLSGPFQTYAYLPGGPRLIYWAVVVFATFSIGSFISDAVEFWLRKIDTRFRIAISTVLMSVAITAFIIVAGKLTFGEWPQDVWAVLAQLTVVSPICAVIEIGSYLLKPKPKPATTPKIYARLPIEKRGDLVALSVSDHYVEITTTKGKELVLMRLSDAIAASEPIVGLQVHRSHWISIDHVTRVDRFADRAKCIMSTGDEIPVSRSFMPAIRNIGLLPKTSHG